MGVLRNEFRMAVWLAYLGHRLEPRTIGLQGVDGPIADRE